MGKSLALLSILLVSLLSLSLASTSTLSEESATEIINAKAEGNLWDVIHELNATTFASLLNDTGLAPLFSSNASSLTVFVPTNEAIAEATFLLNASLAQIKQVLLYHLAAGVVLSKDLTNGQLIPSQMTLPSLGGKQQQLQIMIAKRNNETVVIKVDNAKIVAADYEATNGVAHVVSSVIEPPALIFETANTTAVLSTLAAAVEAAHLEATINGDSLTVFAPINDAFGAALTGYLLLPNSSALLEEVLSYHIVPNAVIYANAIPENKTTSLPTDNNGEKLVVDKVGNTITINGVATVVESNVLAANGVVHAISAVLLPAGFKFDLEDALLGLNTSTLLEQIKRANLEGLLTNSTANTSYTIFAPTNAAFESSNAGIEKYTLSRLLGILNTHIVAQRIDKLEKGQTFDNLNGDTLVVGDDGASISIKGGNNVVAKVNGGVNVADNGNVFSIDKVLRRGGGDEATVPEMTVIIVLVVCVPFLLGLLAVVLLWDLRNWWKKKQVLGYSPISGDEYEN